MKSLLFKSLIVGASLLAIGAQLHAVIPSQEMKAAFTTIEKRIADIIATSKVTKQLNEQGLTTSAENYAWEYIQADGGSGKWQGRFRIHLKQGTEFVGSMLFSMYLDHATCQILKEGIFDVVSVDQKYRSKGYRTQLILLNITVFKRLNISERKYKAAALENDMDQQRLEEGYRRFGQSGTTTTEKGSGYAYMQYVESLKIQSKL